MPLTGFIFAEVLARLRRQAGCRRVSGVARRMRSVSDFYARPGHAAFCLDVPAMCAGNVRRRSVRHGVGHLVGGCMRFCRPVSRAGLAAFIIRALRGSTTNYGCRIFLLGHVFCCLFVRAVLPVGGVRACVIDEGERG